MVVYEVVSRVSSGISIVAALFIVATFLLFPTLRKPMNRLIFHASAGNIVLYIFYCIGTAGIPAPGNSMALCRLQAFSIQMFSTSAMLWTLAMAINVYLIFFRKWAPSELRRLELTYFVINYGFTFLHSLIFLIVDVAPSQAGIYGPANLWCWVTKDYQWIRFTFGYGITWVACFLITVIYVATGIKILRQNLELKHGNYALDTPVTVLQVGNPFRPANQPILCVTEVQVTSSFREPASPCSTAADLEPPIQQDLRRQQDVVPKEKARDQGDLPDHQSGVGQTSTPSSEVQPPLNSALNPHAHCGAGHEIGSRAVVSASQHEKVDILLQSQPMSDHGLPNAVTSNCRCGSWFPIRLRIPWRLQRTSKLPDPRAAHARRAAIAYCRMSVLMFLSLILVWAPASINRVYLLVNDNKSSSILSTLQAAFNPCQGLCDCIIYIIMSWSSCKLIAKDVWKAAQGKGDFRPRTLEFDMDSDATTLEPSPLASRSSSIGNEA